VPTLDIIFSKYVVTMVCCADRLSEMLKQTPCSQPSIIRKILWNENSGTLTCVKKTRSGKNSQRCLSLIVKTVFQITYILTSNVSFAKYSPDLISTSLASGIVFDREA